MSITTGPNTFTTTVFTVFTYLTYVPFFFAQNHYLICFPYSSLYTVDYGTKDEILWPFYHLGNFFYILVAPWSTGVRGLGSQDLYRPVCHSCLLYIKPTRGLEFDLTFNLLLDRVTAPSTSHFVGCPERTLVRVNISSSFMVWCSFLRYEVFGDHKLVGYLDGSDSQTSYLFRLP